MTTVAIEYEGGRCQKREAAVESCTASGELKLWRTAHRRVSCNHVTVSTSIFAGLLVRTARTKGTRRRCDFVTAHCRRAKNNMCELIHRKLK